MNVEMEKLIVLNPLIFLIDRHVRIKQCSEKNRIVNHSRKDLVDENLLFHTSKPLIYTPM